MTILRPGAFIAVALLLLMPIAAVAGDGSAALSSPLPSANQVLELAPVVAPQPASIDPMIPPDDAAATVPPEESSTDFNAPAATAPDGTGTAQAADGASTTADTGAAPESAALPDGTQYAGVEEYMHQYEAVAPASAVLGMPPPIFMMPPAAVPIYISRSFIILRPMPYHPPNQFLMPPIASNNPFIAPHPNPFMAPRPNPFVAHPFGGGPMFSHFGGMGGFHHR